MFRSTYFGSKYFGSGYFVPQQADLVQDGLRVGGSASRRKRDQDYLDEHLHQRLLRQKQQDNNNTLILILSTGL